MYCCGAQVVLNLLSASAGAGSDIGNGGGAGTGTSLVLGWYWTDVRIASHCDWFTHTVVRFNEYCACTAVLVWGPRDHLLHSRCIVVVIDPSACVRRGLDGSCLEEAAGQT